MRRIIQLLICLWAILPLKAQTEDDGRIAHCLNTSDWFELRRVYEQADKEALMPMLKVFAESMISTQFNQPEKACASIRELMNNYGNEIGVSNMLGMGFMLASNEAKQGKYTDASQTLSTIIKTFEPYADSTSLAMHRQFEKQYRILGQYPTVNQTAVSPQTDFQIPFRLDSVGPKKKRALTMMIPAAINQKPQDIVFDTGAGVNVVSTKAAKELGLDLHETLTRVTGVNTQSGTFAIAQEMQLGNLTLKNVPFFVVDISSGVDSIDVYMKHLDMIIGVDFINAMKEIQIDFEKKEIVIPQTFSSIQANETSNLSGGINSLFTVEGKGNEERLLFHLDTGAGGSILDNKYFLSHKDYLTTHCQTDTLRSAGAGGVIIEEAYILPNFQLEINGACHTFPKILVSTQGGAADLNYGNFGMDYFLQFKKVIYNTQSMFVRLIKP